LANGSLLSCGGLGDPLINIWDTSNGIMIQSIITNLTTDITSLAVLSNGNLATASSDTIIRIWNAKSGKVVKTLESHTWVVTSLVLLKNGQLASGSLDKTIRIWGN
jgi:WD40 repeat protein